jgi:hypothetical protein
MLWLRRSRIGPGRLTPTIPRIVVSLLGVLAYREEVCYGTDQVGAL